MEVVGLVAACASLTKTCIDIGKALHDITLTYKDAGLEVLSIADQCKVVQLAWRGLQDWATNNVSEMADHDEMLERLQNTVYTGGLILEALKSDLDKATSTSSNFRRRTKIFWNATVLKDHQDRLHRHVMALQLLLQVASMPRKNDRIEMMSVKEYVFNKADESVLSIVPSRMSSRISSSFSIGPRESTNKKSAETPAYSYLGPFENDLFASYVYKRQYRVSLKERSSSASTITPAKSSRVTQKEASLQLPTNIPEEDSDANTIVHSRHSPWFHPSYLRLREGIDTSLGDIWGLPAMYRLQDEPQNWNPRKSTDLSCLDGVDMAVFFQSRSPVNAAKLLDFFWYILDEDRETFHTIIECISLSAGEDWVEKFRRVFNQRRPRGCHAPTPDWTPAEAAGRFFDFGRAGLLGDIFSPSALQLACASRNHRVAGYLLRVGFRHESELPHHHPISYALLNNDATMVKLLMTRISIPQSPIDCIFTEAVRTVLNLPNDSVYWCEGATPTRADPSAVVTLCLEYGADPSVVVNYLGKRVPLIHALVYLLYSKKDRYALVKRLEVIRGTLTRQLRQEDDGTVADQVWEACWSGSWMSPLAIAAAFDAYDIFQLLLKFGAKVFSWTKDGCPPCVIMRNIAFARNVDCLTSWYFTNSGGPEDSLFRCVGVDFLPGTDWSTSLSIYQCACQESFGRYRCAVRDGLANEDSARSTSVSHSSAAEQDPRGSSKLFTPLDIYLERDLDASLLAVRADCHHQDMLDCLRLHDFPGALRYAQLGAEIGLIFCDRSSILLATSMEFLCHIGAEDAPFLRAALKRIALATDIAWIKNLYSCFYEHYMSSSHFLAWGSPVAKVFNQNSARKTWQNVLQVAMAANAKPDRSNSFEYTDSLQMAVERSYYYDFQWLLRSDKSAGTILHSAAALPLNTLQKGDHHFPPYYGKELATEALQRIITSRAKIFPGNADLSYTGNLYEGSASQVVRTLLEAGADACSSVFCRHSTISHLHSPHRDQFKPKN